MQRTELFFRKVIPIKSLVLSSIKYNIFSTSVILSDSLAAISSSSSFSSRGGGEKDGI